MKQCVVADSSPLIALLNIGQFSLLERLFGKILIPPMVFAEVSRGELSASPWFAAQQAGFIVPTVLQADPRLDIVRLQIDPGESEAILLADQLGLPLLIDDRAGRKVASQMGGQIIGLVGVLSALRQQGDLGLEQMPGIVAALEQISFRLSPDLKQRLLSGNR